MFIKLLLEYVTYNFEKTKEKYPNIDNKIIKSALIYRYLHFYYLERDISINKVLELNDREIGFLGPGSGCITWVFEKLLGRIDTLNSNSILHDAFGRFFDHFSLGRGYTYAIPEKYTTKVLKRSPFCGQISGILYCLLKRLTI